MRADAGSLGHGRPRFVAQRLLSPVPIIRIAATVRYKVPFPFIGSAKFILPSGNGSSRVVRSGLRSFIFRHITSI